MKQLKVILSPFFSGEEFIDEVSGLVFRKTNSVEVFSINQEEEKLTGIQSALRKNILLPYDKETLNFLKGNKIANQAPVAKEETKVEAVIEEKEEVTAEAVQVEEEPAVEEKKPAAKKAATRKRTATKKAE